MKTRSSSCLQRGYSVVKELTKKNPPNRCQTHLSGRRTEYTRPNHKSRPFCEKRYFFSPPVCFWQTGSSCILAMLLSPTLSTAIASTLPLCAEKVHGGTTSPTNQLTLTRHIRQCIATRALTPPFEPIRITAKAN